MTDWPQQMAKPKVYGNIVAVIVEIIDPELRRMLLLLVGASWIDNFTGLWLS